MGSLNPQPSDCELLTTMPSTHSEIKSHVTSLLLGMRPRLQPSNRITLRNLHNTNHLLIRRDRRPTAGTSADWGESAQSHLTTTLPLLAGMPSKMGPADARNPLQKHQHRNIKRQLHVCDVFSIGGAIRSTNIGAMGGTIRDTICGAMCGTR